MKKENVVYTTMEYYPALKKKEILEHGTTWVNLEDVTLSEISARLNVPRLSPTPNSCIEVIIPNVMVFGDADFER